MKGHPLGSASEKRSPWIFFALVFLLSIPFWVAGPVAERFLPRGLLESLPVSALMFLAPVGAAVVLLRREQGPDAVKKLLKGAFDRKRIRRRAWYVPILFFWPAVMVLQYGLLKLMREPLPDPQIPVLMVAVSFVVFFIAALGEEVGWQGYAIDPLQDRWNALTASIILGIVWAVWHFVPFIQMNRTPTWIAWQCMNMVATRILIVWLCNNTGKSVFAAILFHAMYNVTTVLLPNYGWLYDPFVSFVIVAVAAAIVTVLWGPKTLARYRYARRGMDVQQAQPVDLPPRLGNIPG
jgi:membrane protease YdiL (CAAX protease family)